MRWLLALPLILNLCAQDETLTGYGAAGQVFVLQEIDGTPFPARATITFPAEGTLAGQAPCNSYRGLQTQPYPWFKAEAVASTRRACPDLPAETTFFRALSEMTLSEVSGNVLILSTAEGRSMVFTAE